MTTTSATSGNSLSSLLSSLTSGGSSGSSSSGGSSSTSGTGTLSSAGIGSGLNVTQIVTALVNARQAPQQGQINTHTKQTNDLLNGLSSLSSALTPLQAALTKLAAGSTFSSYAASLSTSSVGTASTLSNATPGNYALNVTQLATAQKRTSDSYVSGTAVGAGTLNIAVGSSSVSISVSATASLSDIATAINQASGNPGVTASVVNGSAGSQLMVSSSKTGIANGFSISAGSGSSAGLATLANKLNTAGSNEALDAQLTIDGIAVDSATNTVTGALNGVTLNLAATGSTRLVVTQDNSGPQAAVQAFVDAYNGYAGTVAQLSSYDKTSGTAGVLLGDTTLGSLQRQMSGVLGSAVPGNSIGTLASLGITRKADGSMALDTGKLTAALNANPNAVSSLFGGNNGYATRLNTALNGYTSPNSIIPSRIKSLNAALTKLSGQQTDLNARMATYQKQLQTQYTNLDSLMSQLNSTSSYLTTVLQQMTSSNSKN
ncbi:flagellar filament capping protein FliD [Dyella subtropica]|uniref:flagellar filament capping protein FliD n=1 Tax=Dyella subtropica TaxID=2992127 RepID=UPI00225B9379|nr:flagellar filament capping protein FliD [Dyella subtropica]